MKRTVLSLIVALVSVLSLASTSCTTTSSAKYAPLVTPAVQMAASALFLDKGEDEAKAQKAAYLSKAAEALRKIAPEEQPSREDIKDLVTGAIPLKSSYVSALAGIVADYYESAVGSNYEAKSAILDRLADGLEEAAAPYLAK